MYGILQIGDIGDNVILLQEKLKQLGLYNTVVTGSFGLATEEGVIEFQRRVGLDETGYVDADTWDELVRYTTPAVMPISTLPTLKPGATGEYVLDLQTKLKALLYYTGPVNGNYDTETQIAVKRFQYNNNLSSDGIVGNLTWNKINSLYGNLNACAIDNNGNSGTDNDVGGEYQTYTVVSGDTLYSIAKRYNTTVDAIKSLNNLTSNTLQIGQILKLPVSNTTEGTTKYTVKSGDTLYAIARRFNTTVDAIKKLNNLTSDTLQIGQVLNIPTTNNEESYINYVVIGGDTLYSIAGRYNTTVAAIKNLNNLTSNNLSIGQVLKIPTSSSTSNYIAYKVVSGDTLYSIARRYNTSVDAIKSLNNLTSNNLSIGQVLKIPS